MEVECYCDHESNQSCQDNVCTGPYCAVYNPGFQSTPHRFCPSVGTVVCHFTRTPDELETFCENIRSNRQTAICCYESHCNTQELFIKANASCYTSPSIASRDPDSAGSTSSFWQGRTILLVASILFVVLAFLTIIAFCFCRRQRLKRRNEHTPENLHHHHHPNGVAIKIHSAGNNESFLSKLLNRCCKVSGSPISQKRDSGPLESVQLLQRSNNGGGHMSSSSHNTNGTGGISIVGGHKCQQLNDETWTNSTCTTTATGAASTDTGLGSASQRVLARPMEGSWSVCGSGSGSGLPLLIQSTISNQIKLEELVGKGRFGEVRRGVWKNQEVAVKVFLSHEEASFKRELDIYETYSLYHSNILKFVAADRKDRSNIGASTLMWLVTDFHSNGSLFDFLSRPMLPGDFPLQMAIKFCQSIAAGLAHLHMAVPGLSRGDSGRKAAIAHCDIKSRNILVKSDGECCLADFGLAVRNDPVAFHDDTANPRWGTKRYLAPEILEETFQPGNFDSYKATDIYATALVFWEIVCRTEINGKRFATEAYPPYHDVTSIDPSAVEMRSVVVTQALRPELPAPVSPSTMSFNRLVFECWHANPAIRASALLISRTLVRISTQVNQDHPTTAASLASPIVFNKLHQSSSSSPSQNPPPPPSSSDIPPVVSVFTSLPPLSEE